MDLIAQGLSWLNAQRAAFMTSAIRYVHQGERLDLLASMGSATRSAMLDALEIPITFDTASFVLTAADLVLNGEPFLPEYGDSIEILNGTVLEVYEVLDLSNGICYHRADPLGLSLRVYAKRVEDGDSGLQ